MKNPTKCQLVYLTTLLLFTGLLVSSCRAKAPVVSHQEEGKLNQILKETPLDRTVKTITIQAVGDLNLSGRAPEVLSQKGMDYPFEGTLSLLRQGDVNFANLEAPISDRGQASEKKYTFRMSPEIFPHIRKAGFNLFSLANNHILDFGEEALFQTMDIIRSEGGYYAGVGRNLNEARSPAIFEVNQTRVGLLAYSLTFPESFYAEISKSGTAFGHAAHIRADVAKLRPQVRVLVVSFHWGAEGSTEPKDYQKELAHLAIDSGADLILGHHPHVPQGIEVYKGRPIFYSLGNYAFGSYSNNVDWGVFARTVWEVSGASDRAALIRVEVIPLDINNFRVDFCPQPIKGNRRKAALMQLSKLSESFGTNWQDQALSTQLILAKP